MKVSLSHKAFFKCEDPEFLQEVREKTRYEVLEPGSLYPKVYQNSGRVAGDVHWIPVTRVQDILGDKVTLVTDRRVTIPVDLPKPTFTLREDQLDIFNEVNDSCIINGKPGFGKTILALAIAYKLGQKTLVIVTNLGILKQWESECKKWFGFSPGILGAGKDDISTPIVISNIQTLHKHGRRVEDQFGLVIVDEMHHCVASTFTKVLEQNKARYKIGLSGTLKRKDGLQVMFKDFFGFKVFTPEVNNTMIPDIHKYSMYHIELSGNKRIPWADRATEVYEHPDYIPHIIEKAYVYYRLGHKVLVVSDRRWVIDVIYNALKGVDVPTFTITGSTPLEGEGSREEALQGIIDTEEGCVLVASQGIFSEGVSCNPLSCLIYAGIVGDNEGLVEQLVGRVQRLYPNKPTPIVVDTSLGGDIAYNQSRSRTRTYTQNGWQHYSMSDEAFAKLKNKAFAK